MLDLIGGQLRELFLQIRNHARDVCSGQRRWLDVLCNRVRETWNRSLERPWGEIQRAEPQLIRYCVKEGGDTFFSGGNISFAYLRSSVLYGRSHDRCQEDDTVFR